MQASHTQHKLCGMLEYVYAGLWKYILVVKVYF